jgi:peptidoglycan/LPS O-acetylase OafA/YrhL
LPNLFKLNIDYSKRVFGLDILRALAITEVVLVHGGIVLGNVDIGFPWFRLIPGVPLFFVLSGFLIGSILIKTFEDNKVSIPVIFNFLKRRWFRTLPNYYLILLLNIIVVYFGIIKEDFSQFNFSFFIFSQNLFQPFYGFFWESWSLTVEEWFYLTFPLLIAFVFLFFSSRKLKTVFFIAILVYLIVPLILRVIHLESSTLWRGNLIKGTVVHTLDSIAYGILGAYLKKYYFTFWNKNKWPFFILGIIIIVFIINVDNAIWGDYYKVLSAPILSLGILLIFPLADSIKSGNLYFVKIITHISVISYSMYLINLALVASVIRDNFMPEGYTQSIIAYIAFWLIVISLSTALYKFYEKPLMDLRDKPFRLPFHR